MSVFFQRVVRRIFRKSAGSDMFAFGLISVSPVFRFGVLSYSLPYTRRFFNSFLKKTARLLLFSAADLRGRMFY